MSAGCITVARVRLTIEVNLSQPWGADCNLGQVFKQARAQAIGDVRRLLGSVGCPIVGEPEVTAILVPEQKP